MFSGIVEESARIISRTGESLIVRSSLPLEDTKLGDSIAVNGCCLTVTSLIAVNNDFDVSFDVSQETLRRTNLGELAPGKLVHLERSLCFGGRVHGHFVTGHVDAVISLQRRERQGNAERFTFSLPQAYHPFLTEKGAVSLSGVSLTVGEVTDSTFSVYLVPHTLSVTTLLSMRIGDRVNLEVDVLARYVGSVIGQGGRSMESLLKRFGYFS